jgi:hypothetical protein
LAIAAATSIIGSSAGAAPVSYTGGTYTQNFDSLPWTADGSVVGTWVNGSTLPGWHASGFSDFRGSDGSVADNNASLFSYGSNGADQALGSQVGPAGGPTALTVRYGVQFVNNTGVPLTEFTVSYTGEQWRDGGNERLELVQFERSLSATSLTTGSWSTIGLGFGFVIPVTSLTPTALDGNLAQNQRSFSIRQTGIQWAPGASLWLRWTDVDEPTLRPESALAIDNFSFTAPVPEPSEWAMLLAGLLVIGFMAHGRRQMRV